MGLFGNAFKKKEEAPANLNWIPLTEIHQLEVIKKQSATESIFVFKHSTRCGISSMVIKQFERLFTEKHQNLKVYYLDLLNYREISNSIEVEFGVMHQSPQVLVIKNGFAVANASHHEIIEINLDKYN